MINVVGVRFMRAGKIYFFDPGDLAYTLGQKVIVETVRGVELGEVALLPRLVADEEVVQPLKKVLRLATAADQAQSEDNSRHEREAMAFAQEKIAAMALEMKLVEVEYTFDKSKLVFYFTADKRIDFRELVKELAAKFRTRIELRQIGVRDEAKMLGGLGVCGQGLCCSTWIGDFAPVSIRHAKDQDLSMNPNKISGVCGRLKCCLRYESDAYEDARARQPKLGDCFMAPAGEAHVVAVNLLRENATLQTVDGPRFTVGWHELRQNVIKTGASGCSGCPKANAVASRLELQRPEEKGESPAQSPAGQAAKPRKPRKPAAEKTERQRTKPARDEAHANQEIAVGSDDENPVVRKRRRWRKRKPKSNGSREAASVSSDR